MIQMYLLTEHKEIHRLTEQMCDCCGGRDSQGVWDGRVHTATFNTENQQGCTLQHMLQCYAAAWMGGEFGGEQMYVYAWLTPFTVNYHNTVNRLCSKVQKIKKIQNLDVTSGQMGNII